VEKGSRKRRMKRRRKMTRSSATLGCLATVIDG
jgi:hypothetical protein